MNVSLRIDGGARGTGFMRCARGSRTQRRAWSALLLLLLLAPPELRVAGYSTGANSCEVPGHGAPLQQPSTRVAAPREALAGANVSVALSGATFKGFLLKVLTL
eukprot:SAG31_NODE_4358_length_3313_cov_2.599876_4_plen_104_part_00